jgi:hypothetical protein
LEHVELIESLLQVIDASQAPTLAVFVASAQSNGVGVAVGSPPALGGRE